MRTGRTHEGRILKRLNTEFASSCSCTKNTGGFMELGAPGKYRNGALYIAHIYLDQPRGSFLVVMLAAAQWCPIVESNVSFTCYSP